MLGAGAARVAAAVADGPAAGLPGRGRAADARRAAARLRAAGAGARDQRGDDPAADPARLRGRRRRRAAAAAARWSIISGEEAPALAFARANIDAWERAARDGGLDAIVVNASGCGTMVKDYGFLLRDDPAYAEKAARIAALARDVTEVVAALGLHADGRDAAHGLRVAYHSACSLQHGQRIAPRAEGAARRGRASRSVDVPEGHLCCGSAGTYNLLQPELAERAARAQARQYRADRRRRRRRRQYRLHHPARRRRAAAGRAYGRAARLGDRRAYAPRTLAGRAAGAPRAGSAATAPARQAPIAVGHNTSRANRRAEQGPLAGRAEIDIGDRQRQLPEQRADAHRRRAAPGSARARNWSGCAG